MRVCKRFSREDMMNRGKIYVHSPTLSNSMRRTIEHNRKRGPTPEVMRYIKKWEREAKEEGRQVVSVVHSNDDRLGALTEGLVRGAKAASA